MTLLTFLDDPNRHNPKMLFCVSPTLLRIDAYLGSLLVKFGEEICERGRFRDHGTVRLWSERERERERVVGGECDDDDDEKWNGGGGAPGGCGGTWV